jgi:hypothetical protein
LFATHLLLTRPTAFQRYGIGSPSYWYGPKVIFETEESYANTHDDLPAKVYVSIGEYENPAGDDRHREQMTPEAREASLRAEAEFPMEDEVGYAHDLVDRLRGRGYSNSTSRSRCFRANTTRPRRPERFPAPCATSTARQTSRSAG